VSAITVSTARLRAVGPGTRYTSQYEERTPRTDIAEALREAADQIEVGDVQLVSERKERAVTIPERPRFEVELERLIIITDSETG
jgi:amphi-Trp domain-containing protein